MSGRGRRGRSLDVQSGDTLRTACSHLCIVFDYSKS